MPVALPTDPFDLVEGGRAFEFPGWQDVLWQSKCFRVGGVSELAARLGLTRANIGHDKLLARQIRAEVPATWRDAYDPASGNAWGQLGAPAVADAGESALQLFDRSLLAILYVVRYLERGGFALTPAHVGMLRVFPVVFSVDQATPAFHNARVAGAPLLAQLQAATRAASATLVDDVFLVQKCITQANAQAIASVLACSIQVRRGRPLSATHREEHLPLPDAWTGPAARTTGNP